MKQKNINLYLYFLLLGGFCPGAYDRGFTFVYKKTMWANNSLITFKNFNGWKGNYCLSIKTIPD
jgi:hypothetical protein